MINFETDINDPVFTEPVQQINEHLNHLGVGFFTEKADFVSANGDMEFYVAHGNNYKDKSSEAAVLMGTPFGNGIWPHMIARAEAVFFQLAEEGVRDRNGNLVPVIMPSAPCLTSGYSNLYERDYAEIAKGNYYRIASEHLDLYKTLGYKQLAGVIAYSYPGVLASATVNLAESAGVEVTGNVFIGDPPNAAQRPELSIVTGFAREGMSFSKQLKNGNIDIVDTLFATKQAAQGFNRGVIKHAKLYKAIVSGMSRGRLAGNLTDLVKAGIDVTLMHATESKVAPRKHVIAAYEDASSGIWKDPCNTKRSGFLSRQEVTGIGHGVGDCIGHLAVLAANAVI